MKKLHLILIVVCVTISAHAYDFTALDVNGNTIYYTKIGADSVEVSNNGSTNSYSGNVVVPEAVSDETDTYRVTTIGSNAFAGSTLSSLILPENIQEIKNAAFQNAKIHTELLYLPKLRKVGSGAFYGCTYLTKLLMPNVEQITVGTRSFTDCYDLKEVEFPNHLKAGNTWSNNAFDSNIMLKSIALPNNLKSIPNGCFQACWSLRYISLPDSIESIGNSAFLGCIWLKTITIPNAVKTIGDNFIGGSAATWMGGNKQDPTRFGGYKIDGIDNTDAGNQLNSIYFESTTPPTVTSNTFAKVVKANVTCYVPFEAVETYKANESYLNAFANIKGYKAGESEVKNITHNSATIRWNTDPNVTQYTVTVYINGSIYVSYVIDNEGHTVTSQSGAPPIHRVIQDTTYTTDDYFVLTLDQLTESTTYTYTINGKNADNESVYHEEGAFRTKSEQDLPSAIEQPDTKRSTLSAKRLVNGILYIEHDGKLYNAVGTRVE